ncbi:TPA: hypothetical protein ACH3X2_013744 [Trebouxia sp. C0005]
MSLPRLVSTEYYVQERSSNIEAQLAETTSQLHDFRLRQSQLESQNLLLELAVPSSPAGLPVSVPQQSLQAEAGEVVLKFLERSGLNRIQQGAALMLTVHSYEIEVKIEDIGRMSHINLANLYTINSPKASPMPVQYRLT